MASQRDVAPVPSGALEQLKEDCRILKNLEQLMSKLSG